MNLESALIDACRGIGVVPPDTLPESGRWTSADVEGGRNGKDDARIMVFPDGDGGIVWNWKSGESQAFFSREERTLNPAERAERIRRIEAARVEAKAEDERRRQAAKQKAEAIWCNALPESGEHRYLRTKGIQPHGIRTDGVNLVIPMRFGAELWSIQTIPPDGKGKRFLKDGRKAGCYFPIGKPNGVLCVCEGFATGASIHEATGHAVAVAFDAYNLKPVAEAMRERFPDICLIVCADDDFGTAGNPGVTKATEAAAAVDGLLAVPEFGATRADSDTDFNDLHQRCGMEAVRRSIAAAKALQTLSESTTSAKESAPRVALLNGADITPEPVDWLWDGWLAAGKLHVLAGAPGTGKTTIALTLAAALSNGGRWPCGSRAPKRDVVVWSGEDGPSDTLVPRLHACGADVRRVNFVGGVKGLGIDRAFDPATDMQLLSNAISEVKELGLLIVDPIVSAVAADSHKNTEVRRALQPLVDLAAKAGCAILGISHFSKGTTGRDPVERVTGSIAFGALARVVLATAKITEEEGETSRLLARAKSNIGPDDGGYRYSLEQVELTTHPGVNASRVVWGEPMQGAARELLALAETVSDPDERNATDDAIEWLKDLLSAGAMDRDQVTKAARANGIGDKPLRRAREKLNVNFVQWGFPRKTKWQLPPEADADSVMPSEAQSCPVMPSNLKGTTGHDWKEPSQLPSQEETF